MKHHGLKFILVYFWNLGDVVSKIAGWATGAQLWGRTVFALR